MTYPNGRPWKIHGIHRCAGPGGRCHFKVTLERGDDGIADVHLEASELLDYGAFRRHVLEVSGRLVRIAAVEAAPDPAAAWLDLLEGVLADEPARKSASGFQPSPPPSRGHGRKPAVPETADIGGGD